MFLPPSIPSHPQGPSAGSPSQQFMHRAGGTRIKAPYGNIMDPAIYSLPRPIRAFHYRETSRNRYQLNQITNCEPINTSLETDGLEKARVFGTPKAVFFPRERRLDYFKPFRLSRCQRKHKRRDGGGIPGKGRAANASASTPIPRSQTHASRLRASHVMFADQSTAEMDVHIHLSHTLVGHTAVYELKGLFLFLAHTHIQSPFS